MHIANVDKKTSKVVSMCVLLLGVICVLGTKWYSLPLGEKGLQLE